MAVVSEKLSKLQAGEYSTQDTLAKESQQETDLPLKSKGQAAESSTMTATLENIQTLKTITTITTSISMHQVKLMMMSVSIQTLFTVTQLVISAIGTPQEQNIAVHTTL